MKYSKKVLVVVLALLLVCGFAASALAADAGLAKTQGGDVENAVFYIAVKESADSAVKYYYYTLDELKAYDDTHDFDYNDHDVQKVVTAQGALLSNLLDNITDAAITDGMIIQYAESDGYHADQAVAIDESEYKDKVAWLTAEHTTAGGTTEATAATLIAYQIKERYDHPDENNVNDTQWKDADNNSGYLRAYRQKSSANPAVLKYLMGAVVSYDGALFSGADGYKLQAVSADNPGAVIRDVQTVTGLVPGMKYAVKAPAVTNASLSSGQPAFQIVTAVAGSGSLTVKFTYDEAPYFTVEVDGARQELVFTDFLSRSVQAPTLAEVEAHGVPYGYYDSMYYRYQGVWLKDLLGGISGDVTLTAADNSTLSIPAADLEKYFVAYGNTQSKTSTNVPEGKRVAKLYDQPMVIVPASGTLVGEENVSAEGRKKVTIAMAAASGATLGGSGATPDFQSAVATGQSVSFNGQAVALEVYNIDGSNYFKLRDIAALVNGSADQFSVSFDLAAREMIAVTGEAYTPVGGELATGEDKSATCVVSPWKLKVDGAYKSAYVYNIGGNNFFKLRDLGSIFGFSVAYDEAARTMLITTSDYTAQ